MIFVHEGSVGRLLFEPGFGLEGAGYIFISGARDEEIKLSQGDFKFTLAR